MNWKKIILCLCFLFSVSQYGVAQTDADKPLIEGDTAKVNNLLQQAREHFNDAPDTAISLGIQAKELAEQLHFQAGLALSLKYVGIGYFNQGKYIEALEYWRNAMEVYKSMNDAVGVANMYNNIGAVHYNQGDNEKALENYLKSLQAAEQTKDKLRIVTVMNNIGALYARKKETYDKALYYYTQALPLAEQLGDREVIGSTEVNLGEFYFNKSDNAQALQHFKKAALAWTNNEKIPYAYSYIGEVYERTGKYDLALEYHSKALQTAEKLNGKLYMVRALLGLANTYVKKDEKETAISFYKRAEELAIDLKATNELKDIYQKSALTYSDLKDYSNAFKYQSLYANIKDTIYNIETDKKLGSLQFDFDLQKKQGEINLLTKDKALSDLQIKRQKFARNALTIGLVLVLMIALLILRGYQRKVRTNRILDQQKDEIEHLVLNILPAEVAKELQVNGHATPRNYEAVSVMFTDFKSFTTHADKLSPQELVAELNACFIAFDNIIGKYELEKIKTIGDSYMCAGGIPTPDDQHVYHMIAASLAIQEYMKTHNQKRMDKGLEPWDLRIGVHVGPVVAGVVGKRKYAYDIWGSTVNIASRMESNGEPGQVNISAAAYECVKDRFVCSYRGKIYAKNVGEIDMYFVADGIKNGAGDQPGSIPINEQDISALQ